MKKLVEPFKNREELKKVEDYLRKRSKRNELIFVLGINSGLRISDILNLNIEDVKNKEYIEIREMKTGKYKKFPLNNKVQNLIKEYLPLREKHIL